MLDKWSVNETWLQIEDLEDRLLTDADSPSLVFKGRLFWRSTIVNDPVLPIMHFALQKSAAILAYLRCNISQLTSQ